MAKVSQLFPPRFFKAATFGEPLDLTVASAGVETFENGDRKLAVGFKETPSKLVLNATNQKAFTKEYGDEMDGWIGKPVRLVPVEVTFKGEMVPSIKTVFPQPKKKGA